MEKDVHFEESSPSLSSNPLYTSYNVETDSDSNDSASTDLDTWCSIDICNEQSLYQYYPHAYIAIVIGPVQQGTSSLPGLALVIDLGDNIDDLPLLGVGAPSSVVTRASSNPLDHSLHYQPLQVEVSVDTYDQQLQKDSSLVAKIDNSLRYVL